MVGLNFSKVVLYRVFVPHDYSRLFWLRFFMTNFLWNSRDYYDLRFNPHLARQTRKSVASCVNHHLVSVVFTDALDKYFL